MSLASDFTSGQGGLKFIATAPPGQGRLIRIPFYIQDAVIGYDALDPTGTAGLTAGNAAGTASTSSPIIMASVAQAAVGLSTNATLKTPQISWATLRIVGFEVAQAVSTSGIAAVGGNGTLLFKDLQIGGGANLFVHEDYAEGALYASSNDAFAGLRDYPLLKSPNVAQVDVVVQNMVVGGTMPFSQADASIAACPIFSCNLVCEILQDDNYGTHVPGPYARKGAMVRRGGSFV